MSKNSLHRLAGASIATNLDSLCRQGRLKDAFRILQDTSLDAQHFASLLVACADSKALQQGKQLHAGICKKGFHSNAFLGTKLLNMYCSCDLQKDARHVFDEIPIKTRPLWAAIIRVYARNGPFEEALKLYHRMRTEGIDPDRFIHSLALKACSSLSDLQQGTEIHDHVVQSGHQSDLYVGASLIDMYAKCGNLDKAQSVFDDLPRKNDVAWNSIIAGHSRFGNLQFARQLFDSMPRKCVISWTTMIWGYVQNGLFIEALVVFDEMQRSKVRPNRATFVSILPACAHLGALQRGQKFHDQIIHYGLDSEPSVVTALVNMYAKCGRIDRARKLFEKMPKKDTISWNAMIAGYAIHGDGKVAVELFERMLASRISPDAATFIGVLSACSHCGLVEKGLTIFRRMSRDYGIEPIMEHYACVVDLLGRAGWLHEAHNVIAEMPVDPSPAVWGALLSACRTHGHVELGEYVAKILFQIEPDNTANYVLLSNIYADAGMWDKVSMVRNMLSLQLKKEPLI